MENKKRIFIGSITSSKNMAKFEAFCKTFSDNPFISDHPWNMINLNRIEFSKMTNYLKLPIIAIEN